jgi:hypothetical protein
MYENVRVKMNNSGAGYKNVYEGFDYSGDGREFARASRNKSGERWDHLHGR